MQELFLSHNVIDILPAAINKLTNLELLDVSYNRLTRIDQIGFMPNLRILNITGNVNLTKLPIQLTTCDSLTDLIFDAEYILYPPNDIIERGTIEILKYLLEQNGPHEETQLMNNVNKKTDANYSETMKNIKQTTANMIDVERGRDIVRELNSTNEKHSCSANDRYSREKVCIFMIF